MICQVYAPDRPFCTRITGTRHSRLGPDSGKERQRLNWAGGFCVTFFLSPDGKIVAAGLRDEEIRLYDVATGKELCLLAGKVEGALPAIFSPDGKWLAATCSSRSDAGPVHSDQLKIWSVATGEEHQPLKGQRLSSQSRLAFSADSKLLAAQTEDQRIQIWEVATGKKVCPLDQQRADFLCLLP